MKCARCPATFTPKRRTQRYCSPACLRAREPMQDAEPGSHGYAMTLDEVGAALGLKKSRVGQIEASALRKLRAAMGDGEAWI